MIPRKRLLKSKAVYGIVSALSLKFPLIRGGDNALAPGGQRFSFAHHPEPAEGAFFRRSLPLAKHPKNKGEDLCRTPLSALLKLQKFILGCAILVFVGSSAIIFLGCEKTQYPLPATPKNASPENTSLSKEKKPESECEKLVKESQELRDANAKLQKDFQAISMDRDNLIAQAKLLLADRGRAKELEDLLEKSKKNNELLEAEKEEAVSRNLKAEEEHKKLEIGYGQLQNEKKQLEDMLAKERDKSQAKKLEQNMLSLQKENAELKAALKESQAGLKMAKGSNLSIGKESEKAKEEIVQLRQKIDALNKNYAEAFKKNKALEQKALNAPQKFAEIAHQNKVLVKQASNMHYNLGVFYTKNKEYSRAIAELEEAVKLRPDDAYAHFNLGYIYAEYVINRPKAIEHFRHYLRLAKKDDKDLDWVKKYILTWQAWEGREPME